MPRARHLSRRTEAAYAHWAMRYLRFHGAGSIRLVDGRGSDPLPRPPGYCRGAQAAASSHLLALNALLFLFRHVMQVEAAALEARRRQVRQPSGCRRCCRQRRCARSIERDARHAAAGRGWPLRRTGMRVGEGIALRIQDIDFRGGAIAVCSGRARRTDHGIAEAVGSRCRSWRCGGYAHRQDLLQGRGHAPLPAGWRASIPARRGRSAGSSCSHRAWCATTRRPGSGCAGMCRRRRCRRRSGAALQACGIHRHASLHTTAAFVRDPSAGAGHGHPHDPAIAGASASRYHHGLHPRPRCGAGGDQSAGLLLSRGVSRRGRCAGWPWGDAAFERGQGDGAVAGAGEAAPTLLPWYAGAALAAATCGGAPIAGRSRHRLPRRIARRGRSASRSPGGCR